VTDKYAVLFLTERGQRHQQDALAAAPRNLQVTMLRQPERAEILSRIRDAEFLISERAGVIDANIIAAGKQLRLIQRLGSLTHDIDLQAAQSAGVPVSAWPVYGCILVAEHMLMQMLVLAKRLPEIAAVANGAANWGQPSRRTDEDTFAYNWSGREGIGGMYGATVGILGFGEIGAELARRLSGFRPARILYYKRQRLPVNAEVELGLTYSALDQLLAESDFVCNLLPYYPETDGLLGSDLLAQVKPGAFLVSCGSGSVIDEAALTDALRRGHLAGAALDTFEWEPIRPDNPLLPLARDPAMNVLLTPHTAAGSGKKDDSTPPRSADYENILRVIAGEPVLFRVT
jgi:phosphoglycerate dehydrogenase-like enzyme